MSELTLGMCSTLATSWSSVRIRTMLGLKAAAAALVGWPQAKGNAHATTANSRTALRAPRVSSDRSRTGPAVLLLIGLRPVLLLLSHEYARHIGQLCP